ncbi:MAG TPA: UvrB/UvrC motif-containing protein [Bacillota bacterium]|nr:UvrB/UvrC motif-containing protein [Bacillota bacterium]
MICQECGQEQANVFITKIINGKKIELHLCERCAREKEELEFSFQPQFTLHNLFGGLLHENIRGSRDQIRIAKTQCPSCALTFAQFSQIGRLGCSDCFAAFGDKLQPLLRRIHGSARHTGKVPRRGQGAVLAKRELERLKEELHRAVQKEEFEEAARMRDQIRAMEKDLEQGGNEA